MDGLNIKEESIKKILDEPNLRLEAEYYVSKTFNSLKTAKGEKIIEFVQYGTSEELNEDGQGFPVLRLNEFDTYFIGKPSKFCSKINKEEFENLKLKQGDVLICRTNGNPNLVGRTSIVMEDEDYAYASYLFKVRPKNEFINAETLTVFLRSKYGRVEIDKYSMTSNQTNFSPAKFREIDVPLFTFNFQNVIKQKISDAYIKLRQSQSFYQQAEALLLTDLNLQNWQPTQANTEVKSFQNSFLQSGRLDAEYYQPKFDEVIEKIKQTENYKLSELAKIKKSIEPGSAAYMDEGIPFIRVADLSKFGLTEPEIHLSPTKELEDLFLKKDTVLLSKDGSVGIAYKMEEDMQAVTSGAILHLTVKHKNVLSDYLTLVLNSALTQLQAERDAGGSIIQHWRLNEIESVLIPVIKLEKQQQIAQLIQHSFLLKKQSQHLLQTAKLAVEKAIEESEEAAMEFLKPQ